MVKIEVDILEDRELVMEQMRSTSKEMNKTRKEMEKMREDSRVGEEVKVQVHIYAKEAGAMLEEMVLMEDVTYPRRVKPARGKGRTEPLNTVKIDDWEQTEGREMERDAAWEFGPAGCQWRNDLAESRVKASKVRLKRVLVKMLKGEDPTPSHNELCTILATAANVASDLPTTLRSHSSNNFMSLALKHLLLGRTLVAPLKPPSHAGRALPRSQQTPAGPPEPMVEAVE